MTAGTLLLSPEEARSAVMSSLSSSNPFPPLTPDDEPDEPLGPWVSDQGDGTYRNPVLFADYSDPDAIRVGSDYWLTASSFNHVPGLPILHSRDLVNWTLVNHALRVQVPRDHFSVPRHGQGVWAPSLRYHAGKYWIYYPDPDFGIYVVTSDHPLNPWSTPTLVKAGKGLIDPCPLWDNDGQAYLIHGWARSRSGISNLLTLNRLSPDSRKAVDEGTVIINGDQLPGWNTLEGPKLYKHAGYYFVFAPAGGVATGYQAVFRSRNIYGPYQWRIVLEQGSTSVNGPHQGAWVDTPNGEHWFLHFQERPAYGRVMHLQPMRWRPDNWPTMGNQVNGKGEPVLTHPKPTGLLGPLAVPDTSDEFDHPKLGLQWQWQANPRDDWADLNVSPGSLRLRCVPLPSDGNHWLAPHLLLQKFAAPRFVATTLIQFSPQHIADTAGLMVFGRDYAWLGLRPRDKGLQLLMVTCEDAAKGSPERVNAAVDVRGIQFHLRLTVDEGARCFFSYSLDGDSYRPLGREFIATSSLWVGAKFGLFASTATGVATKGHAEFRWFRVEGERGASAET